MSEPNQTASNNEDKFDESPAGVVEKWIAQLDYYKKEYKDWTSDGEKIVQRYKNDKSQSTRTDDHERVMFNILWSNVQTLKAAHFARMPRIMVERRIKSSEQISRLAARIAENCGHFNLSQYKDEHETAFNQSLEDRLLPGRGLVFNRYVPEFEDVVGEDGEPMLGEDGEPVQKKVREKVVAEYVFWQDFAHNPCRTWWDVVNGGWGARRSYLAREDAVRRFGKEKAKKLAYEHSPKGLKEKTVTDDDEKIAKAEIWEVWDKATGKVYWISSSYKDAPLDVKTNPLKLQNFYPFARPLFATLTTDSLKPTADYAIYRGLAEDLETITKRISSLTEMVRLVGAHDASVSENLSDMFNREDGSLLPIKAWAQFQEAGGFKGVLQWVPMQEVAETIKLLHEQREIIIGKIYEITGISDIIRGNTNPNETATAQQIKGQFATLRIAKPQGEMQRFLRDNIAIQLEIIVEHFDDQTIQDMGGYETFTEEEKQLWPQAVQLLRDDRLRTFKIEIETDSTIAIDEAQEKEDRREYLQSVGTFWQQAFQVAQIQPEFKKPMLEAALWAARAFRSGRQLETVFEKAIQDMVTAEEQAAQNPQPPPPDPEMIKAQAEQQKVQGMLQLEQFKAQKEAEIKQFLAQHKQNLDMQKLQMQLSLKQQAVQGEISIRAQEIQQKMQLEQVKAAQTQEMQIAEQMNTARQEGQTQEQPQVLNVNL